MISKKQILINNSDMLVVRLNGLYFADPKNARIKKIRAKAIKRANRRYKKFLCKKMLFPF